MAVVDVVTSGHTATLLAAGHSHARRRLAEASAHYDFLEKGDIDSPATNRRARVRREWGACVRASRINPVEHQTKHHPV